MKVVATLSGETSRGAVSCVAWLGVFTSQLVDSNTKELRNALISMTNMVRWCRYCGVRETDELARRFIDVAVARNKPAARKRVVEWNSIREGTEPAR